MKKSQSEITQKHLKDKRHQLRVWVTNEKYDTFKALVDKNGDSIYSLVNTLIDDYIAEHTSKDGE